MEGPAEKGAGNPVEEQAVSPPEELTEERVDEEVDKQVESEAENQAEDNSEKPMKKHKQIIRGTVISLCALLVIYFGMTIYFTNHFNFGSKINGINVSGKNVEAVKALMASELQEYTLNLRERGGNVEVIKASEVDLKYISDEEFKNLKDSQNPFAWVLVCFNTKDSKMKAGVSYDEKLLKERIDRLACFDSSNIIEPKNPSFQYEGKSYVIIDEVPGNRVDKDILFTHVTDALSNYEAEIDLESINCYIKPKYNSKSEEIMRVRDTLNKYVSSVIIYTFGSRSEVLDGSTINNWLTVGENLEVSVDEGRVKAYIDALSNTYDTTGITRNFVTSSERTVQVSGGDFGRSINKAKEAQNLISAIKEGKSITKEPAYSQTVFFNGDSDIGNTYVEIDLTGQHIWFYKNGSLIVEGDIVSGNVSAGHTTPKGVYRLKYKAREAVLRGPGYAAPVDFWMPFNGGIGIHDASWRSVFGGSIYKTSGSHGCINCPYKVAKAIYYNIEAGTPVVCY